MICSRCKSDKDKEEFHKDRSKASGFYPYCKECRSKDSASYYDRNREKVLAKTKAYYEANTEVHNARTRAYYKVNSEALKAGIKLKQQEYRKFWRGVIKEELGFYCSSCGYHKCASALDVHHTEPDKKTFSPAYFMVHMAPLEQNIKVFIEELSTCIILCSNCHRELHANEERL
jgi:murein tripeptide amidase MpaA